jgi:6-pyruvoyltetrahydropterin/6-carboxytetrahydropterin synthase
VSFALTRRIGFHARHRYYRPEWTEAENLQRFGSTATSLSHGHLYRIDVTITGPLDPATQMVFDLGEFDNILAEEIVQPLAGTELNDAIARFAPGAELPSCEALAAWCWERVAGRLHGTVRLERVRVAEDETLWADCTGTS